MAAALLPDQSCGSLCAVRPRELFGSVPVGRGANFAWLNQFRRLRSGYGKRADIHEAFLSPGAR